MGKDAKREQGVGNSLKRGGNEEFQNKECHGPKSLGELPSVPISSMVGEVECLEGQ